MAVPDVKTNLQNVAIYIMNPVGGTPTGSRVSAPSPVRGRIIEVGFMPCSLVASATTLAVLTGDQTNSQASTLTTVVTSTLGTFASQVLFETAVCSVIPASNVNVNAGDPIQWVTSGGNTSAIGTTCYAIIRRG